MIARAVAMLTAMVGMLISAATPAPRRGVPLSERPVPVVRCAWKGQPSPEWLTLRLLDQAGIARADQPGVCLLMGCESGWTLTRYRDNRHTGDVYGPLQIMASSDPWRGILARHGWTAADLIDPNSALVSLTVAAEGRAILGRWGGDGGWSCAGAAGLR